MSRLINAIKSDAPDEEILSLITGESVHEVDDYGYTPLYWAAKSDHLEVIRTLLANGANVNQAGRYDRRPLHQAAREGNLGIVGMLLDAGADVNLVSRWGHTPLYWAAKKGHVEIVKALLTNGADVNLANDKGDTPLYWAAKKGYVEIVQALLDNNADVNRVNEYSDTPLRCAAHHGHVEIVQALLANSADVNLANDKGDTPLTIATRRGHVEIVDLLQTAINEQRSAVPRGALVEAMLSQKVRRGFLTSSSPNPVGGIEDEEDEEAAAKLISSAPVNVKTGVPVVRDPQQIFDQQFIRNARINIDIYNDERKNSQPLAAIFYGKWRSLPELDSLLADTRSAKHCAYVLSYLYNSLVKSSSSGDFAILIIGLRTSIMEHIKLQNPAIFRQIKSFIVELTTLKSEAIQSFNDWSIRRDCDLENRPWTYDGPSKEELDGKIDQASANRYSLDYLCRCFKGESDLGSKYQEKPIGEDEKTIVVAKGPCLPPSAPPASAILISSSPRPEDDIPSATLIDITDEVMHVAVIELDSTLPLPTVPLSASSQSFFSNPSSSSREDEREAVAIATLVQPSRQRGEEEDEEELRPSSCG